ncbi:MAG: hypothetical protein ACR2O7_16675, partial [Parasphingorhabdus sp.]
QAEADAKAEEAKREAEIARLEALKIQVALAWRDLSEKQFQSLVNALKGKDFKVYNTYVGDDPEAARYRNQIDAALREAGIETSYFSGWKQAAGVSVLGEDTLERKELSDALTAAGIAHAVKKPNSFVGKEFPGLIIGTKLERL